MNHPGLADYVILFLPHSGFVQQGAQQGCAKNAHPLAQTLGAKMNLSRSVAVLPLLLSIGFASAETIVANCASPKGWRVDFSESKALNLNSEPEVEPDGFSGSNPQFIYDSSNPKILTEITDPIDVDGIDVATINKLMPSEIKRYTVISIETKFIFAVDLGDNSLWTYALYPDLGFLIIGRNTAWGIPRGENAVGATYYARCKFTRG